LIPLLVDVHEATLSFPSFSTYQAQARACRVSGFKGLSYKPLEKQVVLANPDLDLSRTDLTCTPVAAQNGRSV